MDIEASHGGSSHMYGDLESRFRALWLLSRVLKYDIKVEGKTGQNCWDFRYEK